MKILIFQNHPCEDAASAGAALEEHGADLEVIECYNSRRRPDVSGDALLVLGGPMNVYEAEKHPFLKWETDWIRTWAEEGRPLLGLCLGAQLLSVATGGKVTKNPFREIGHFEVAITPAGTEDPIFSSIKSPLPVVQWHSDTFLVPPGGTLLATGTDCLNQAFRVFRAIGLQFHLEIGRDKMLAWINEYARNPEEQGIDPAEILAGFEAREKTYAKTCRTLIRNFIRYEITNTPRR